jgi:cation diffusion facilitator CzcD-associated flavoprotein CzcO
VPATTVRPDHELIIVGSGFAGLGMAIRLKQEGENDFVLLEQDSGIGGTWRANTYPGCACDVQSHLYSFSFAPNPEWTRMFAPQEEIRTYLERTADEHDVRPHIQLESRLTAADWDEEARLWRVEVNEGERTLTARHVVSGLGALSRPAYPDVEGIERFEGRAFHSADWDHDYDFAGKRVAVIGTGASSIQFVPKLAKQAAHLDLFQRTPPWIVPKPDRKITRVERFLFRRLPFLQNLYRQSIYWRLEARVIGFAKRPEGLKLAEQVARFHIRRQISDPKLRRKVTPDYRLGCKRVLISNDYYPALGRPNVDVHADGVTRVTERGIVTPDGVEHEADVIVFGTGFRPNDLLTPLSIRGTGGVDINDAWRDGTVAYKGTTVAGFPNMFVLVGPNTGLGHSSMVFMIESQIEYVLDAMRRLRRGGAVAAEVRPAAVEEYNRRLQKQLSTSVWSQGGCVSWYLDSHGNNRTLWPGFTFDFRRRLRRFDDHNYDLTPAALPAEPAQV